MSTRNIRRERMRAMVATPEYAFSALVATALYHRRLSDITGLAASSRGLAAFIPAGGIVHGAPPEVRHAL